MRLRPWTFWYSIYSYLYVYFFLGDSGMAPMMQSNVKDTYCWETSEIQILDHIGRWQNKLWQTVQVIEALDVGGIFLQIWVVDVDGDSSFDWGKTLGPSKPVFLGIKCSLLWSLAALWSSYLWHELFLNSTMFGSVIFFSIKSFHGQKDCTKQMQRALEIRRFIQVQSPRKILPTSCWAAAEKFIRNQPIPIFGFVVTSKTRTKKSRNTLESAGECYDGPVWGYQCPSSFHCVPQELSISCLWCFQWTSNCINTFYAHLCNCRGLPWRGSFKMTGKRKSWRAVLCRFLIASSCWCWASGCNWKLTQKKTACCFAWGCFTYISQSPIFWQLQRHNQRSQVSGVFLKKKGRRGAQRPAARASDDFRFCWGSLVFLAKAWSLS